ncbi:S41 family peptidase [Chryseobacterium lathyri]|uniref:C-terminal processing protease CtpA/Prc n=1 Tax=Chryseobacterium lathyri TaxID=395933 RepID=A0ABT9SJS5_9FLAO|nr:S41 family peptidase [Chryseobacterium lathyri]MDP9959548.1 C-terminal processing protease CtpA/Prc [Chryseobacterium lathyri]
MKIKLLILSLFIFLSGFFSAQITNSISLNDRLYGASKFWSDVNYNFVYMYKVDQLKWNAAYKEAIANVQKTKNDYEYFRELQKLCSVLKDGHTQVYLPEYIQNQVMTTNFGAYRLFLTDVNGRIYIYDINKSKEKEIPVGSEILKVNDLPVDIYQNKFVKPFISTSTESVLNSKASFGLLAGLEGEQFDIEVKTPKGEIKKLHLTHAKTEEKELSSIPLARNAFFEFKWLENQVAYVAIRTFNDASVVKSFEANISELKKAKKIILDIRNNGGGSGKNALNIAKYFTKGDTIYGAKSYSREIIPTERAIGSFLTAQDTISGKAQWGLSKEDATRQFKAYSGSKFYAFEYKPIIIHSDTKFIVPTIVLTNNNTASAAEDFLIYLYNEKNITRVGDYTNGSTGQPLQIELPGNGSAWICTKKVTLPNNEEFIGIGIKPEIIVKQNLNDVLYPQKYDSQLTEALKYLQKNRTRTTK